MDSSVYDGCILPAPAAELAMKINRLNQRISGLYVALVGLLFLLLLSWAYIAIDYLWVHAEYHAIAAILTREPR